MLAWRDGALLPIATERLSRGWLYGDGCFTTVRVQDGKPWFLAAHHQRLTATADFLGFTCPLSLPAMAACCATITSDSSVRFTLVRGGSTALRPEGFNAVEVILSWRPVPKRVPLRLTTLHQPTPLWHTDARWFKHLGYTPAVRALQFAASQGCDDAVWLNDQGEALSLSTGCIVWQNGDDWLTTPSATPSIGVAVLSALRPLQRAPATLRTLQAATAVYLLSSVRGLVPVQTLDGFSYTMNQAALEAVDADWYNAIHSA